MPFWTGVREDELTELEHENRQLRAEAAALNNWLMQVEAERDTLRIQLHEQMTLVATLEADRASRFPLATLKLTPSEDAEPLGGSDAG